MKIDPDRDEVFTVETDGKVYTLAAQDALDRLNWIQEIIKTKEVPQIIFLLKHEKLSNYALRALVNIANSTGTFYHFAFFFSNFFSKFIFFNFIPIGKKR